MIEVALPWPPSMNAYWRCTLISVYGKPTARVLLSKAGRQYKARVKNVCTAKQVGRFNDFDTIRATIVLHPPDKRRIDIDNRVKAVLDALQDAGVLANDNQVDELLVIRGKPVKGGRAEVNLEVLPES